MLYKKVHVLNLYSPFLYLVEQTIIALKTAIKAEFHNPHASLLAEAPFPSYSLS